MVYLNKASNPAVNYEKRLFYNKKASAVLLRQNNDSINSEQLITVAKNFYLLNSWKDLKRISTIGLKKNLLKKDSYFVGQSYRWLGVYYENISVNDSAFYYYLKAEKIFNILKCINELGKIHTQIAQVKYYSNDFLGSEVELIKALKIARSINDKKLELDVIYYLAQSSLELKEYDKSLIYFEKALAYVKTNKDIFNVNDVSISLSCLGYNFFVSRNYKKAIFYFEQSLENKNLLNLWPILFCQILDQYSSSKLKVKLYDNIEKIHLRASKIRDSLHIDQGRNLNKLYLSEYYQATNQITKAQKFAFEAYYLSKNFRNVGDLLSCLKQLSKVDPKNALKYSQEYIRISDSMQLLERQTRNKFAKITYETEEITSEKEQAIKQKWISFGISLLLLLIGVLLFIIIHQRTKQKELRFLQRQQKANDEIYQLIQNQQTKMDEGRQIEKKRIAQDLHDGIMNRLASTRLNLHIILEKPSLENIKKCKPFIDGIQDIEKEIRNIAHDLNTNVLADKTSFVGVIESFVNNQRRISSSKYHLEIDRSINWEKLAGFKKIHLYRILQEAIQNVEKHAQAKNIVVSILKGENQLLLEIFDDGKGFSLNRKKKGIGLQNIFSRAKACNGIAEIKSKENEGTTIIVKIPI